MTLKPGNIDGLINAAGSQGEPLDGRPKQHQGRCPCDPALAAEGSGARGGEATPHTRAEAWGTAHRQAQCACGGPTDAEPTSGGAPAIQLDRASLNSS